MDSTEFTCECGKQKGSIESLKNDLRIELGDDLCNFIEKIKGFKQGRGKTEYIPKHLVIRAIKVFFALDNQNQNVLIDKHF